jgi:hypothetical protein
MLVSVLHIELRHSVGPSREVAERLELPKFLPVTVTNVVEAVLVVSRMYDTTGPS